MCAQASPCSRVSLSSMTQPTTLTENRPRGNRAAIDDLNVLLVEADGATDRIEKNGKRNNGVPTPQEGCSVCSAHGRERCSRPSVAAGQLRASPPSSSCSPGKLDSSRRGRCGGGAACHHGDQDALPGGDTCMTQRRFFSLVSSVLPSS